MALILKYKGKHLPEFLEFQSSLYVAVLLNLTGEFSNLNTYTQQQIQNALNLVADVFEGNKQWQELPANSKQTFAECLLKAANIEPKSNQQ